MKRSLFFAVAMAMTMIGCSVSIKDGKVPSKYLSDAQKYVGTYHGQFEGRQMDLKLAILADGTAQLTVADLNGNSELINGCEAQIGKLISADVDTDKKNLQAVSFSFQGEKCQIAGQEVTLDFNTENNLTASIVKSTRTEYFPGDMDCSARIHCTHTPGHFETVPDQYLTGMFSK